MGQRKRGRDRMYGAPLVVGGSHVELVRDRAAKARSPSWVLSITANYFVRGCLRRGTSCAPARRRRAAAPLRWPHPRASCSHFLKRLPPGGSWLRRRRRLKESAKRTARTNVRHVTSCASSSYGSGLLPPFARAASSPRIMRADRCGFFRATLPLPFRVPGNSLLRRRYVQACRGISGRRRIFRGRRRS